MSHFYTKHLLPGDPKRERVRYFTAINEAVSRPLEELIREARDGLKAEYGYSDLTVERVSHNPEGRYLIVLTCYH